MVAKLKVCGITRPEDLECCAALGVDAVGINLWAGSRRGLSVDAAENVLRRARAGDMAKVGVFVHASAQEVRDAMRRLALDVVQVHDDRPPEPFAALGWPWIWVIRGTPELATLRIPRPEPTWVLLDAMVPGFGGRGHRTDWVWAARAVRHFAPLPVWLAGGLHPDNAAEALRLVAPAGLDVASGSELVGDDAPPGAKDPARIEALLRCCRQVNGTATRDASR